MIIEVWSCVIAPNKWEEANDWGKRIAEAHKKQTSVVSARAFHSETGNPDEFMKIHIELDFLTMAERQSYYQKGGGFWADEIQALNKENTDNQYIDPCGLGHHYYSVLD